jgi:hypothetical protein
MSGAIPPLPQYAFMAWCSVKHNKDNFTFLPLLLCYNHFHILPRWRGLKPCALFKYSPDEGNGEMEGIYLQNEYSSFSRRFLQTCQCSETLFALSVWRQLRW